MIEVMSAGIGASFQDLGRPGFRKYGIPLSGAMDQLAVIIANQKLGNLPNSTVVEFTLKGPLLKFHCDTQICITGAPFLPIINDQKQNLNVIIPVKKGDVLKFCNSPNGIYGYIAIQGGFLAEKVLGSQSYYKGITDNNRLNRGDILKIGKIKEEAISVNNGVNSYSETDPHIIRVLAGPDYDLLNKKSKKNLFCNDIRITNEINRMGYRLDSTVNLSVGEVLTVPVQPGTIQLTPGGKLLALMRDAQTTGGYARILQLTEIGISKLAQKRPEEKFRFKLIER